jgi:hypothetical protein
MANSTRTATASHVPSVIRSVLPAGGGSAWGGGAGL